MADNLWALREQKRLSVATLATRAGLPIGLILEYESGTKSIDTRHLARLARALYVEETEIRLRCDPRPGGGPPERLAPRPEARPAPPAAAPGATRGDPGGDQPPVRQRSARPPRSMSEPRPPAPARPSQIAHLNDLIQRLGKDRTALEAGLGKPIDQLDRLDASNLLGTLQIEMRSAQTPDRHRAYLPEAVDQYELRYLTAVKEAGIDLQFALFDGSHIEGQVVGFGPYNITVRQSDDSEITLNKLAIASYRKRSIDQPVDQKGEAR